MATIQIKQFPNKDAGYFVILHGKTTIYFGFAYPDIVGYCQSEDLEKYLENLAKLAISENANEAIRGNTGYFEFDCGRFELQTNPNWAKDIYE